MANKTKEEAENEFVEQIISAGGINRYICEYFKGSYYWFFDLANDTERYWTNLSEENQKKLGVSQN